MTRSLPEKTFEHWCSIHLTYRYRAKLRMWWPAHGADVQIERSRTLVGKRFWLELKTTEWDRNGFHRVQIDLHQLDRYGQQPVPDYYVFAIPVWDGVLGSTLSVPWLGRLHPSDVGYQSHSSAKWFANWTWVVSGSRLRHQLRKELTAYRQRQRAKVMTIGRAVGTRLTWSKGISQLNEVSWHEFWNKMETCGGNNMPAQFVLPRSRTVADPNTRVPDGAGTHSTRAQLTSRETLVSALAEMRKAAETNGAVEASEGRPDVYSPTEEQGQYVRTPYEQTLDVTGFEWEEETSRGLISMTPTSLKL